MGINDASFLSLAKHAARGGEGRLVVIFFLLCARCSCRTCHEILGDSIKRLPSGLLGDRPKPAANIHLPFSPLISRHYRTASFQSDSAGESPFGLCCPLHTIKVDGPDLENGRAHEIDRERDRERESIKESGSNQQTATTRPRPRQETGGQDEHLAGKDLSLD